jgi:hypothetical protein
MNARRDASAHHCHAIGCVIRCKPEYLMCAAHWRMVPSGMQGRVYAAYRPGQCDDMSPSARWVAAAKEAIAAVARREGVPTSAINRELRTWDEFLRVIRREGQHADQRG